MRKNKELTCIHCKKPYNIHNAIEQSDKIGTRIVKCPYCNGIVGKC